MADYNPFALRASHPASALTAYRILVPLSWALVVVVGIYYTIRSPDDVKHGHRIFRQANKHTTPFSQNVQLTGIYWILILLSQLTYVYHLFARHATLVTAAANVAMHFIINNLCLFLWIMLWTRNYFWGSEVILVAHFINQHAVYWRHRRLPPFVHLPAVAGPYAWTLFGLFWNGAVAVNSNSVPARIVANVFIWVIFAVGSTHIVSTQDYILGYCLSGLMLSLAVKQLAIKVVALQWIFAFVIFTVFLLESIYLTSTKFYGRDSLLRSVAEPEIDREREPLLNESV